MNCQRSIMTSVNAITSNLSISLPALAVSFLAFGEYFLTSITITSNSLGNFSAQTRSRQTSPETSVPKRNQVKLRRILPCSNAITSNIARSILRSIGPLIIFLVSAFNSSPVNDHCLQMLPFRLKKISGALSNSSRPIRLVGERAKKQALIRKL